MKYIIECWNPISCRYEKRGEYSSIERAEIMFNKPYFVSSIRRLIRIQEEILYTEKSGKYANTIR